MGARYLQREHVLGQRHNMEARSFRWFGRKIEELAPVSPTRAHMMRQQGMEVETLFPATARLDRLASP